LANALDRCASKVATLTNSRAAISLLDRPPATSSASLCSLGVSPAAGRPRQPSIELAGGERLNVPGESEGYLNGVEQWRNAWKTSGVTALLVAEGSAATAHAEPRSVPTDPTRGIFDAPAAASPAGENPVTVPIPPAAGSHAVVAGPS
jgi:hypothetical protein